ncbi:MAG TPA: tetratricopeptide repeat protein [Acidobacteriota bacterium]|nr:tetratricopeptide repeat protein [Acidobacteriota bacterium]
MKAKERHEIKTDKFLDTMSVVQEFMEDNSRTILFVVGTLLIIVVGWFGITWFIDFREGNAAADLKTALDSLQQARYSQESAGAGLADVEKELQAVTQNHGGTASGTIARFRLGILRLDLGKNKEAIEDLQAVIDSRHPYYWELASLRLGEVMEGEDKQEEACEIYRRVADAGTGQMPLALFAWKAGNCLEELGKNDEALSYYNKAKASETTDLNSSLSNNIERKIKELAKATASERTD